MVWARIRVGVGKEKGKAKGKARGRYLRATV